MIAVAKDWRVWLFKQTSITLVLGLLCLIVGASCVILPAVVPIGVIGIAAMLLLWVTPDLQRVPRKLSVQTFYCFVFVSLCVPYYVAIVVPGLPYISFRRIFIYAFVACNAIAIGASSDIRAHFWSSVKSVPLLRFFLLGYLGFTFLSAVTSQYLTASISYLAQMTIVWFVPAVIVVIWVDSKDKCNTLFKLLALCLVCDAVLALVETYQQAPPLWKMLPASTRDYILEKNPLYARLDSGLFRSGQYRAISSFTTALSWAEMVGMLLPVALFFLLHGEGWRDRLIGIIGVFAVIVSLTLAQSRGGFACTIAGACVFFVAWIFRAAHRNPKGLLGPFSSTLTAMGLAAVALAVAFVPAVRIRVLGGGSTQLSDVGRDLEWAAAMPKIMASPIWGYGFGTAGIVVNYQTASGDGTLDDYRINLLVEGGAVGMILFYGLIIVAITYALRAYVRYDGRMASFGVVVAASLTAYFTYQFKLSQTDNLPLVMIMAALAFPIWNGRNSDTGAVYPSRAANHPYDLARG